jgi:hypothetical protein
VKSKNNVVRSGTSAILRMATPGTSTSTSTARRRVLWWAEDATRTDVAHYVILDDASAVVYGRFPKAVVLELGTSLMDPNHVGTPRNAYAVDITGLQVQPDPSHVASHTLLRFTCLGTGLPGG